jgi:hypothetical protein
LAARAGAFPAAGTRAGAQSGGIGHCPMPAMPAAPIIAHRAEFVDALGALRRGRVLVRAGDGACSCVLDGAIVHHSYPTLAAYGLIDEFENPAGFAGVRYYRLSARGREFADRALARWRQLGVLQRLAVRLAG